MTPRVPILVGPTASGKTSLVLDLAERRRATGMPSLEVVSADSRQVYRKLDIGTAKPTLAERSTVPHHLVDLVDPSETYSAGRFRADAEAAIAGCLRRGVLPFVVGGTGLYLRALTAGLSPIPPVSQEAVARLQAELAADGLVALYRRLVTVDPRAARLIKPNDPQRTVRALAVYESTGKTLSEWWAVPPRSPTYRYLWLGLRWPRERLRGRIRQRVEAMLDGGLEEEVRALLRQDYSWKTNALRTVGYKEWRPYLDGEISLDEVRQRIVTNTVQYAKRQMTWFNAVEQINWLDGEGEGMADRAFHWLNRVEIP